MKKLLFLALLLCGFIQAWGDTWTDSNGVTWSFTATQTTATITGCEPNSITVLDIPSKVYIGSIEYKVTAIGEKAFAACTGLTSVTIPEGVTSIGKYAFYNCSGLKKVIVPDIAAWCDISFGNSLANPLYYSHHLYSDENTEITNLVIPEGVTKISAEAFSGCIGLTSVTIPEGVTFIEGSAFYGCTGLTSVNFPQSLRHICNEAFYNCSSLTSVTFPSSMTVIDYLAFYCCSSLTSVTFPSSMTSIDDLAFYGCSGLTSIFVSVTDKAAFCINQVVGRISVSINKPVTLIDSDGNEITEYAIPEGVSSIGSSAFSYCTGLTSVTIPEGVTSIGNNAFRNCSNLTSVTIPNSLTSIGNYAFKYCSGLTSVNIPEGVTTIGDDAFYQCTGLTSVTIPSNVTSIGDDAFYGCSGLSKVIVPDIAAWCGVNFGNAYANPLSYSHHLYSDENTEITNLVIPEGVTSICNSAFYGCSGLTSVTIPSSFTRIGSSAFSGCSSLTSVTIPSSVTSIGNRAFSDCSNLTSVTINSNDIMSKSYSYNVSLTTIFGEQVETVVIGDGVTSIGKYAFYNCKGMTNVAIPSSVTSIGEYAFYGCRGLTSVTIPASVTSIGYWAFYNCSNLTSVAIPEGVTNIGNWAFYNCFKLKSVTINSNAVMSETFTSARTLTTIFGEQVETVVIGDGVMSIGYMAFYNCSGLTSVTFPLSVTYIDSGAFYNCSNLTNVTIPEGVTSIGDWAFYNCSNLTSVTINSNAVMSNNYTSNKSLTKIFGKQVETVVIGDGVTSIGDYAFSGCSGLTSVTIPEGVTSIGSNAFSGCSGLTSIKVPITDTASFCGNRVIGQIGYSINKPVTLIDIDGNEITEYVIPEGVESIGQLAFYNCSGLTSVTIPNSVTSIGNNAFRNCSNLTSVTIPNSLTSIGNYAFKYCSGLTSVTIPEGVTKIGDEAFDNCPSLTEVYCYIKTPLTINSNTFSNRFNATLYVPSGSKSAYQKADYWKDFKKITDLDAPTDIHDASYDATEGKTIKVFKNGRVKILKDGKVYDLNGTREK